MAPFPRLKAKLPSCKMGVLRQPWLYSRGKRAPTMSWAVGSCYAWEACEWIVQEGLRDLDKECSETSMKRVNGEK